MNLAAIEHRPRKEWIYPSTENEIVCRLQTARRDVQQCRFCYSRGSGDKTEKIRMECFLRDEYRDYYSVRIAFSGAPCYLSYYFELTDGEGCRVRFFSDGMRLAGQSDGRCFRFLWANRNDGYVSPDWCDGRIYYQIFPERFCNGDRGNDPPGTKAWGSAPTRTGFMGGDLKGIIEHLDDLANLGVNALYLTPVFLSPSNHKYDTEDYYRIDPAFGSTEDLKRLVRECHRRDIRILLDGVFNHCGFRFGPFQDVIRRGELSPYKNWFTVHSFPLKTDPPSYSCFGNYNQMPKFNHANPEVRKYLIGVAEYWIRTAGIDGWRLDVADEIETDFWEEFGREIRARFPQTFLMGETWGDAARLVFGNRLDSAMNYLFRNALVDWIATDQIDARAFDFRINRMLALYSEETDRVLYNLLDSHDTSRFLHDCGGRVDKMKLAVGFQMTFVGCPAILYGDEVGLTGANDPDCRGAMIWDTDKRNLELEKWYRKMISVRKSSPLFTRGSYRTILCDGPGNLFGFMRKLDGKAAYVLLNNSDEEREIEVPVLKSGNLFREAVAGTPYRSECAVHPEAFYNADLADYKGLIRISLPSRSIRILQESE